MMTDFISMGGYGIFVWSAFIFTFTCCLVLFLKTKKELKKQEKMFLEKMKKLPTAKVKIAERRKATKHILVSNPDLNY